MDFFDFITQDEIDDLPHDDPRAAFVAFTRIAHRRLGDRLKELDKSRDSELAWREGNDAKQGFMNVVIAAAKKYQIEPFATMDVPKRRNFDSDEYMQLRADLDHYVTQLVLDNSARGRRDSVLITPELKSSIKTYVHHLRELIQHSEDLDPSKREVLLRRLSDFEAELEKKRLNLLAVSLLAITLASAPGGVWSSVDAANKLIGQIMRLVGDAKTADDSTRRLPSAETPLAITAPRKPEPEPDLTSKSRRGDLDDEIPF
jgi:hypothetical protein